MPAPRIGSLPAAKSGGKAAYHTPRRPAWQPNTVIAYNLPRRGKTFALCPGHHPTYMRRNPHPHSATRRGRREVLRHGLVGMGVVFTGSLLSRCREATGPSAGKVTGRSLDRLGTHLCNLGPLREPDANGLRLAEGFTSRVIARSSHEPVPGCGYRWHAAPDGGAVFVPGDGGWIYVSNAEVGGNKGGAGALRFDANGQVVDAYSILENTTANCAGGSTPWGTWLSCEEFDQGRVWECDPAGSNDAVVWPALGAFKHEAAAVDPARNHIYLTEDRGDGLLYRFVPDGLAGNGSPDLSSGRLEAAQVLDGEEGRVVWHRIRDPSGSHQPTRLQAPKASAFKGGEGMWFHNTMVFFTTTRDDRVWAYDVETSLIEIVYDHNRFDDACLTGVDNVTVSSAGDVLVAEDGGDNQICTIAPDRGPVPVVHLVGHDGSEITGPAFDPSGTRLYFSSQRGETGQSEDGVTYEVTGPFRG